MTCKPFTDKDGKIHGFICTRGRPERPKCSACETRPATLLCDFPLEGALAGKTCDRPLCARCAASSTPKNPKSLAEMADTFDLCPPHARLVEKRTREQEGDTLPKKPPR